MHYNYCLRKTNEKKNIYILYTKPFCILHHKKYLILCKFHNI